MIFLYAILLILSALSLLGDGTRLVRNDGGKRERRTHGGFDPLRLIGRYPAGFR